MMLLLGILKIFAKNRFEKSAFSADRDANEIAEAASSAKQDLSDDNRLEGNRRLEEETTRVQ